MPRRTDPDVGLVVTWQSECHVPANAHRCTRGPPARARTRGSSRDREDRDGPKTAGVPAFSRSTSASCGHTASSRASWQHATSKSGTSRPSSVSAGPSSSRWPAQSSSPIVFRPVGRGRERRAALSGLRLRRAHGLELHRGAVTKATQSLISNTSLVTKVYFPRLLIPLAAVLPGLLDLGISLPVLVPYLRGLRRPDRLGRSSPCRSVDRGSGRVGLRGGCSWRALNVRTEM